MNANKVAAALKAQGINVFAVRQGNAEEDGEVTITAALHVQVPTRGRDMMVVKVSEDRETFTFLAMRTAVADIVADLRREGC